MEVFIVSAVRTPLGRFLGSLATLSAPRLGSIVVGEAVKRAGIGKELVDEVIMGCVLQAGLGQNPARQAAIFSGLPPKVAAFTVNKVCGSGLKAVALAAQAIRAGDAEVIVAGGMESMSNAPYIIPEARTGSRLGHARLLDSMVHDGLWDVYNDFHMGMSCELVAEEYKISRTEMDEFALQSHRKAVQATEEGRFKQEIVPIEIKDAKGRVSIFEVDEGPRRDTDIQKLAQLRPAFKDGGTVTPGNASSINDGAAALVVVSEARVNSLGLKPIGRITGYATGGVEPKWVMMAPVEAVKNWETKTGLRRRDMELIEINEAFAASTCALIKQLELDPARVNVHGGGVALGHPIGCSGARILTTLIYALKGRGLKRGLATMCLGGGNAIALSVELV